MLRNADVVALEVTLDGTFFEVAEIMHESGFVVHDIVGQNYRISDDALIQVDMVFVKSQSSLREGPYSRPDQGDEFQSILDRHLGTNP